jgi:CubicO group peptidase (beta-lactamase class C family)
MMRHFTPRLSFTLLLSMLLVPLTATSQQPADADARLHQVVDQYMQPFLNETHVPGAIVGISLHGQRHFYAYGTARDDGTPFTPDTVVEIGSCTKVFTTTLFALGIKRKQIAQDDSIQQYMPHHLELQPLAQKVTPLELADFTSGMPDDPPNAPKRLQMRNIEHYAKEDFLKWVSHWSPDVPPPAPYLYSNAGVGLLGYLLETSGGRGWEDQLNTDILKPLGMPDTMLRLGPEQKRRLAQGHHANGTDAPSWPIVAWYAAGDLRSTARDMLSFGEANLGHTQVNGHPSPAELTAAMQLAQTPIYMLPNGRNKQAMSWVVNLGNEEAGARPVILKNGGTVGFGSVILVNPSKDLALFIVANQNRSKPADTGIRIARHLP